MTIGEIITAHFNELFEMCHRRDLVISQHNTTEDVFQNVMVTAVGKFKEKQITEEEGLAYLRKSLAMELHFMWSKINNTEVPLGDLKCPPSEPLFE